MGVIMPLDSWWRFVCHVGGACRIHKGDDRKVVVFLVDQQSSFNLNILPSMALLIRLLPFKLKTSSER